MIDREAPGLAEAMRLVNPPRRLSRQAGTRDTALVLNTPGSAKGAIETLDAVLDVLPTPYGSWSTTPIPSPRPPCPGVTA
ncbi:MAG: hypothetical protein R2695_18260 [Acidimicrobiales bacterium]